jgi:monosaccharide-transporting ATPase
MATKPVLAMRGITKEFPGVRALNDVTFRLIPGEVHALMGENGAGKSTLIKVLTGVHPHDAGDIELDGSAVRFSGPLQATDAGISTVYQEVNLCPNLSVAENIMIGREPRRFGRIQWSRITQRARELLARLHLDIDVTADLGSFSIAVQQMVAIARAIDIDAKVLILDEPTSSLDAGEVARLFDVMRRLKDDGIAICFVTHFLDQVYEISDRITVLRNGGLVGEYPTSDLPQLGLIEAMTGKELRTLEQLGPSPDRAPRPDTATPLLQTRGLGRRHAIDPFDLRIDPGQVVGLAGLLGSGRTEFARLLFGADRPDHGTLTVDAKPVTIRSPQTAIAHRIAFCSENRRAEGLVGQLTVAENILLALQARRGWARPLPRHQCDELVARYIDALHITPADPDARVDSLSGGNQQKVVLARWLITEPRLLILDEPTRGIDVGAKADIQRLVLDLSDDGVAVLYISAELDEVLRLSHTVEVLRDRRLVAELTAQGELDADRVLATIAGGTTLNGDQE